MREKIEWVLGTLVIAFGTQGSIKYFNKKSKSQERKEEIENLNLIIEQMAKQIDRLEKKIEKMEKDFHVKEKLFSLPYSCENREHCPVLIELRK